MGSCHALAQHSSAHPSSSLASKREESVTVERLIRKHKSIERAVAGYPAAGGTDEPGMRAALEAAHDEESLAVGDEVICARASLIGSVVSIEGADAIIARACRGKSIGHATGLTHIAHEG
jgi:hypothetical protein